MSNDNTGALFKNEKKREGKQDADYQGQISIDGKEYWLNAWLNTSKDGAKKYMALKARIKEDKPMKEQTDDAYAKVAKTLNKFEDSDIPF